jgi:hypothetical protein
MMRWRYRNSAVANRHALHSDYYSTTQKTANPLNEWWTAATRTPKARRFGSLVGVRVAHERGAMALTPAVSCHEVKKPLRHNGFCNAPIIAPPCCVRSPVRCARGATTRSNDLRRRHGACENFFHRSLGSASREPKMPSTRANQLQVIRGDRPVRDAVSLAADAWPRWLPPLETDWRDPRCRACA